MKAILWTKYGPPEVLQLKEVSKPSPQEDEVLIRIHAAAIKAGDCQLRGLDFPPYFSLPMRIWLGFGKPRENSILGNELSGEVEAAGRHVKIFREGDQVFGSSGFRFGAYAEYVCLPEEPPAGVLVIKPAFMTHEEAAALAMGGPEALHFLRKAAIRGGQKILINGAGGTIGTFAVQLAKYYGAEVTAVDSAVKLDMLRAIGADHVVDYTQEDFTRRGETYDVIFDVVGKSSFSGNMRSLKEGGFYLIANPGLRHRVRGGWALAGRGKKVIIWEEGPKAEDYPFLEQLVQTGRIKPVIDRRYALEQTADAHRYIESGQAKGIVVINVHGE